jgi:hypothetical protein
VTGAGPAPTAADLRAAAVAAAGVLAEVADPAAAVPAVDADVRFVVVHVAQCLWWYAHDLVAGAEESPGPVPGFSDETPYPALVREVGLAAEVLARAVSGAGASDRGWHPWGLPDAAGIAAIGIAEIVLHTDDVATALGRPWTPPAGAVLATLARLFPDAPDDADPWSALRWSTGRADLPGRERVTEWRYQMDPLRTRQDTRG